MKKWPASAFGWHVRGGGASVGVGASKVSCNCMPWNPTHSSTQTHHCRVPVPFAPGLTHRGLPEVVPCFLTKNGTWAISGREFCMWKLSSQVAFAPRMQLWTVTKWNVYTYFWQKAEVSCYGNKNRLGLSRTARRKQNHSKTGSIFG